MRITRPRSKACEHCGQRVSLIDCGVRDHRRARTRREQVDGRCTGYVYAHDASGGIECRTKGWTEAELRAAWGDR